MTMPTEEAEASRLRRWAIAQADAAPSVTVEQVALVTRLLGTREEVEQAS